MIKKSRIKGNLNILYNENIPQGTYLLIDEKGNKLGIFEKNAALKISEEKNIDLLLINSDSDPMVARLVDYSKYRYNQQKKNREMKKKQHVMQIKEVHIGPTISSHDLDIKVKNIKKFLSRGDKVKIIMRFRSRMIIYAEAGKNILKKIISDLQNQNIVYNVDTELKLVGNQIVVILLPTKFTKIFEI